MRFSAEELTRTMAHVAKSSGGPTDLPDAMQVFGGDGGIWSKWILLNEGAAEVWVHWCGKRSLPCLNALGVCPKEIHGSPLSWRAYIPGVNVNSGRVCLLAVTYDAARNAPNFCIESTALRLRGRLLRMTRTSVKKNAPQRIELLDESWKGPVGPSRNVWPALNILWCKDPIYRAFIAENVTGCEPGPDFGNPQEGVQP